MHVGLPPASVANGKQRVAAGESRALIDGKLKLQMGRENLGGWRRTDVKGKNGFEIRSGLSRLYKYVNTMSGSRGGADDLRRTRYRVGGNANRTVLFAAAGGGVDVRNLGNTDPYKANQTERHQPGSWPAYGRTAIATVHAYVD
jgi:hypothetical protein